MGIIRNYTYSPLCDSPHYCTFEIKTEMEITEKIGKRLRELRITKGLSQEKFSFECSLDRTYVASIERGKRNVSVKNIEKITKALGISLSDFFNSSIFAYYDTGK